MGQQIANGDRRPTVFVTPERDVHRNRIIKAQATAFDHSHDQRRRRENLRQRREIEHRVVTRGCGVRFEREMPEGLVPEWLVRRTYFDDSGGEGLVGDSTPE
jgi:hypothetical protein